MHFGGSLDFLYCTVSAGKNLLVDKLSNWSQTKHLVLYVPFPVPFPRKCPLFCTENWFKLVFETVSIPTQFFVSETGF